MVQTYFPVADEGDFDSAITAISIGGTDAAINTAYTIALTTAPIALSFAVTLDLEPRSSLLLDGNRLDATGVAFTVTGTLTTDLNVTGTITLDGGTIDNVALTTNGGGTPVAGNFVGQIADTSGDGGDSVVNDGTITDMVGPGAIDFASAAGTVQNGSDGTTAALISGTDDGVDIAGFGLVQNGGTIIGNGNAAVDLGSGTADNGTATDLTALLGSAQGDGVFVETGTGVVNNFGTISGPDSAAVYLAAGGTLTNGASADTTALVSGFDGVVIGQAGSAFVGSVYNDATIAATGDDANGSVIGVVLQDGGTVENLGSASAIDAVDQGVYVAGASGFVQNAGSIDASGGGTSPITYGVELLAGGTVENLGSSSAIEAINNVGSTTTAATSTASGVLATDAGGLVHNEGTISASGTVFGALAYGVDLEAGGTVDNGLGSGSKATVQGTTDGVRIGPGAAGAGALVDNEGTILGAVGVDFTLGVGAAGTIVNDGLIESTDVTSAYAVEFGTGNERLVLDAGGMFIGDVLGYEAMAGSTTTLEFAAGTTGTWAWLADDSGTVTDTAGAFGFSAFGTIALDTGAAWTLSTSASSTQTIQFQSDVRSSTLALAAPATTPSAVQAVIDGFGSGGTIDLLSIPDTAITFHYAGSTLNVLSNGGTVAVLDLPGPFFSNSFTAEPDTAATGTFIVTNVVLPCFLAGTNIRTPSGEVRVQDLKVGDHVSCVDGGVRAVVWIGHRRVDVARHPSPDAVRPVRIRRSAFADAVPRRDLLLSPDHAVYVDGVLVPVKYLVNGHSVEPVTLVEVEYWHVELDRHDVLWAEGLPAESYLETGNRSAFANGGGIAMLHPTFDHGDDATTLMWEAFGYAPLVTVGDVVSRVRDRLASRAAMPDAASRATA